MQTPFYSQKLPVEVLVLRRKPVGGALPHPSLLVIHSAATSQALTQLSPVDVAVHLGRLLGQAREEAWHLASNFAFPQRPVIEGVGNLRAAILREKALIDSALHSYFSTAVASELLQDIKDTREKLQGFPCFAYVVDYPMGRNLATIRLPVAQTSPKKGLFAANQPVNINLLEGELASGLSDPSRYLIAGKI